MNDATTDLPIEVPGDVLRLLKNIFRRCNKKVATSLSLVPTLHESTLDQQFVTSLADIAPTTVPGSGWIVSMDVHFLGGGHHFGRWEIADIGVIVALRRGHATLWSKAAILQSKRLFPIGASYNPEAEDDRFRRGFGRLHNEYSGYTEPRLFTFDLNSRYQSLDLRGEQIERVLSYEGEFRIPVHYLLYNPLVVPWSRSIPVTPARPTLPSNRVGCRVLRSANIVNLRQAGTRTPSFGQVATLVPPHAFAPFAGGWRLEDFIVSLVLGCHEGRTLGDSVDSPAEYLFFRRSYPIAIAFAINLELPDW